jgi:hypothetical protein
MVTLNEVREKAGLQAGFITAKQLRAMGFNQAAVRRRVKHGHLVKAGTGLYALPGVDVNRQTLLRAAALSLPGATVSHQSAAFLHSGRDFAQSRPTVTVPMGTTHDFPGAVVHETNDLSADQVVTIDGLQVTTPARTILDLAGSLSSETVAEILDDWLARRIAVWEEVSELLEQLARRGKRGVQKLRSLLAARGPGQEVPNSVMEQVALRIFREHGLPEPILQFSPPWWTPSPELVDFGYLNPRLIIEFDSRRWHGRYRDFEKDRERDNRAQLASWRILRFTWADLKERPEYVVACVRRALGLTPDSPG